MPDRFEVLWPIRYQWVQAGQWVDRIRDGLEALVPVLPADLEQPYKGIVLVRMGGDDVAIDYSDYVPINRECADRCVLYLKMQYDRRGYGVPHVVPGGYVARSPSAIRLAGARAIRRLKQRRYDVHARFGLDYAPDVRLDAMRRLQRAGLRLATGKRVRYERFLAEVALSRVCLDLPGNGPFCFRLVDYLGVGSCIVAPRHPTVLHVPLVQDEHIVYAEPDLSDLVEHCEGLLANPAKRERLARSSREYYDRYLRPTQLARYYLHSYFERR